LLITRLRGWSGKRSALNFLKLGTDNYCALLLTDVHLSSPNTHNQTHTAHPTCSALVGIHRPGSVFSTRGIKPRCAGKGHVARGCRGAAIHGGDSNTSGIHISVEAACRGVKAGQGTSMVGIG